MRNSCRDKNQIEFLFFNLNHEYSRKGEIFLLVDHFEGLTVRFLRFWFQRLDPLDDEDFVREDHEEKDSNDDEWIEEQGTEMIILKIP